jgi:hypothetical protein
VVRKDLTLGERTAIADAIVKQTGDRQGRPGKKNRSHRTPFPKGETEHLAARKAGLGSRGTCLRMRAILERGDPNWSRR